MTPIDQIVFVAICVLVLIAVAFDVLVFAFALYWIGKSITALASSALHVSQVRGQSSVDDDDEEALARVPLDKPSRMDFDDDAIAAANGVVRRPKRVDGADGKVVDPVGTDPTELPPNGGGGIFIRPGSRAR